MTSVQGAPVFGALVRQHRLAAGLTQAALAERAGISERAVQHLERGLGQPQRETLRRLAGVFVLAGEEQAAFEAAARPAPRRQGQRAGARDPSLELQRFRGADAGARAALGHASPEPGSRGSAGDRVRIRGHLRVPPTGLIGREHELALVQQLLERPDVHLVVLVGPGGVGKTRLAMAATRACAHAFADGAVFVDLTSVPEPSDVPTVIAGAIGMHQHGLMSAVDALLEHFKQRQVLLVLDNFEHLLGAASVVSELIGANEQLKVLVTSRVVLRLYGERDLPVPPLALPEAGRTVDLGQLAECHSIRLFVERVTAVKPEFVLSQENASAVAGICRSLDGLPLAIELAAARTRVLPPQALLARLAPRLPILVGNARDLPTRFQSLRAAIDWSYSQLASVEQALFRRLAVFAGGFSLDAAAPVCLAAGPLDIDLLDGISALIDASLLWESAAIAGEPRFRMLETIREFALEQLSASGEMEATRRAHVAYYVDFAEKAEREQFGPDMRHVWDELTDAVDNIRAILQWCVERSEAEPGLRIVGALRMWWQLHGYSGEGRDWVQRVLALAEPGQLSVMQAKALVTMSSLAWVMGDLAEARGCLLKCLAMTDELHALDLVTFAHFGLGLTAMSLGDLITARELIERSVHEFSERGNRVWEANATVSLGLTYLRQSEWQTSRALMDRALRLARAFGNPWLIAIALWGLGNVASAQREYQLARAAYEECLAVERGLDRAAGVAQALIGLAWLALEEGKADEARRSFRDALARWHEVGRKPRVAECFEGLACVAALSRQPGRACRLLGAADALWEVIGKRTVESSREKVEHWLEASGRRLDVQATEAAMAAGRAMALTEVVAYAQGDEA